MRHPDRVLTRAMIAEHVWDYDFPNVTNVIDVHIRQLRRKLGDPYPGGLIETVRGAGYRLRADRDHSPAAGPLAPDALVRGAAGAGDGAVRRELYVVLRQQLYASFDEQLLNQAALTLAAVRVEDGAPA